MIDPEHGEEGTADRPTSVNLWEQSEALQVLESPRDSFIALDRDYKILFVNRAFLRWGGRDSANFVGRRC
jgi:PAS domain-containing protein